MDFSLKLLLLILSTITSNLAFPLLNENFWYNDNNLAEKRLSVRFSGNDWIDNIYVFRCVSGNLQWAIANNAIEPQQALNIKWYVIYIIMYNLIFYLQ